MPPYAAASVASAISSSVFAYGAGGYCSDVETPTAPCSIASRTSAFIRSSSAGRRLLVVVAEHHPAHLRRADVGAPC